MPSGYETRQPGKQTFAFTGPNPVQVSPNAQGNSRGAQTVGGESRSGVVAGQEAAPMIGPQLGSFFEKVMEPHLRRRQNEEFIKGAITQMGRQAGDEIKSSGGGFSKIFGQSAFVEGAINYSAQKAVAGWVRETQDREDDLKKMSDGDLAKYVQDSIEKLRSGDQYTDNLVQAAVFEQAGPAMQHIAKKRYVWEQENAQSAYSGNVAAQSDVYQKHAIDARNLSAPTDAESAAFVQATNNMRAALIKPFGMSDETYRDSLTGAYLRAAESGNGYVVRLLKESGFLNVLDDGERVKLEDSEARYAARANNKALMDPAINKRVMELESEARLARLGRSIPGGANGHAARWSALNEDIKRLTGFDQDLLDANDIVGKGMSALEAVISAEQRREERMWQLEDREDAQAFQLQQGAEQAEAENGAANLAWINGQVRSSVAVGVKEPIINKLANNDYERGNYARIVQAYKTDGWISPLVREKMRAKTRASIGEAYSEATKVAHAEWTKLNKMNPAAAMSYYGDLYPQMANFDSLVGAVGPQVAFARAFNNPAQYSTVTMPSARRAEAQKEIKEAVADMETWAPWGRTKMNESTQRLVFDAIWQRAAVLSRTSPLPMKDIVSHLSKTVFSSGEVERYGPIGWRNRPNTTPIGQMLGLQQDEADSLIAGVIDKRLKAAGYSQGAYGKGYDMRRLTDPQTNKPIIAVMGLDDDKGHAIFVNVPFSEFQSAANRNVAANVATYTKPRGPNRVMRKVLDENTTRVAARGMEIRSPGEALADGFNGMFPNDPDFKSSIGQAVDAIGDRVQASADKRAARHAKKAELDPYRRIAGESQAARIARIDRETR